MGGRVGREERRGTSSGEVGRGSAEVRSPGREGPGAQTSTETKLVFSGGGPVDRTSGSGRLEVLGVRFGGGFGDSVGDIGVGIVSSVYAKGEESEDGSKGGE